MLHKTNLTDLPNELLLKILLYCSPEAIAKSSMINKLFYSLAEDDSIWEDKLKKHFPHNRYTPPYKKEFVSFYINNYINIPKSKRSLFFAAKESHSILQMSVSDLLDLVDKDGNSLVPKYNTQNQALLDHCFSLICSYYQRKRNTKNQINALNLDTIKRDNRKRNLLYWACLCNQGEETIRSLIKQGCEVNVYQQTNKMTPLIVAVMNNNFKTAEILLNNGACINVKYDESFIGPYYNKVTVLCVAAKIGDANMVQLLLNKGGWVNHACTNGDTPLSVAIRNGHHEIVKLLLDRGATSNAPRYDNGDMPLHTAAEFGYLEIIKLLLERKTNINAVNDKRNTALIIAARNGHLKVVEFLVAQGATLSDAVLSAAVENGHLEIIEFLLTKISVNIATLRGAVKNGQLKLVKYILEKATNITAENLPLAFAAGIGQLEIVKFFLEKGANIEDNFALHLAKGLEVIKCLLEAGAKINAIDMAGCTPFYIHARSGNLNVIKYLLDNGATLNVTNHNGSTPLHAASENGHLEVVKYLLEAGIDINVQSNDGLRPLYCAVENENLEVVKYLLVNGASFDDSWSNKILKIAVSKNNTDVIKLLHERGVNEACEMNVTSSPGVANKQYALPEKKKDGHVSYHRKPVHTKTTSKKQIPSNAKNQFFPKINHVSNDNSGASSWYVNKTKPRRKF